jgi:hypothetical protein
MPYDIIKRDNKFCVIKAGEHQKTLHCYDAKEDAQKYLAALEIHASGDVKSMEPVNSYSITTIQPISFKSIGYKAGIWSRIVGMAKQVRFSHYQDYSIYYFNTGAVIAQISSNITAGAGQDMFLDALNGIKAVNREIQVFNNSYGVAKDIQSKYNMLLGVYRTDVGTATAALRLIVTPSTAGGVGLGTGKSSAKIREVKAYLDKAAEDLDSIGSLFKEYYKQRLGADDYVHTEANSKDQEQLDEVIADLKNELIDVVSNIKSFARLPFMFQTQTKIEYKRVPQTSTEQISRKQPRGPEDYYDRYAVDEVRQTTHENVIAVPKEVHVISEGSRQYAIIDEAKNFMKFYTTWYSNFSRQFKIYSRPIGAIQGLITPIIDDFSYFSNNKQIKTDEKAFEQATNVLIMQITKVLKVLGQIKLN